MRFPGDRPHRHYFPVSERLLHQKYQVPPEEPEFYLVGLDQLIVDLEVEVTSLELAALNIPKGESNVWDDVAFQDLLTYLQERDSIRSITAGGAVANTLHNYTVLSGERAFLFGAIDRLIGHGSPAFRYVIDTPREVNLDYLTPLDGHIATAITFVTEDRERTFVVNLGITNGVRPDQIPEDVVTGAAAVLQTAFVFRDERAPIYRAGMRLFELAKQYDVPVCFSMGTASLVEDQHELVVRLLRDYTSIATMNSEEATALTGEASPLAAANRVLDWCDLAVVTVGAEGMWMAGWVDRTRRRPTDNPLESADGFVNYNEFEFSRIMRREDCEEPMRVYTHVYPFLGGPGQVENTSGAGDSAIAAVLHDVSANLYHRTRMPRSDKHPADTRFLTYSSLAQTAKYGNRVAYEVLRLGHPRLMRQLPELRRLETELEQREGTWKAFE